LGTNSWSCADSVSLLEGCWRVAGGLLEGCWRVARELTVGRAQILLVGGGRKKLTPVVRGLCKVGFSY